MQKKHAVYYSNSISNKTTTKNTYTVASLATPRQNSDRQGTNTVNLLRLKGIFQTPPNR